MKYYLATKLENAPTAQLLRDELRWRGHTITYDWTLHGSVQREGPDRIREVAEAEVQGILDADLVVVILPGGRGTHTELGIALGAGKRVILAGVETAFYDDTGRECGFYRHPQVTRVLLNADQVVDLQEAVAGVLR